MTEFIFIRPWWLVVILPGVAFVWWLRRHHGRGGRWESIVEPALLPQLIVEAEGVRREWPWFLMAVATVVAGFALAGPAFERLEQPAYRSLAARVIALDVSRSMEARDLSPSRMVRARQKVSDLLLRSRDGRTGLVVFAGDAFVVAPLTRDADTLLHLLAGIDTGVVPVQGSRPDLGLLAAARLLERNHGTGSEIVLVTDGTQGPQTRNAAATLAARGIRVSVLAAGSREGAPIPLPEGGFLERPSGVIVVARTDTAALRAVADAGGGRFATVTADDADVDWLTGARIRHRWFGMLEETVHTSDRWRDEGPWFVLLLLPMAALAFRRGWLLVWPLAIWMTIPVPDAGAFELADLWARRDQRTARAIERGDADRAAALAPDHQWRGTALYRARRFHEAAEAFATGDAADDHYNRATALARAGNLRGALDAYREALERQPAHPDAAHNRSIVESLLANASQRAKRSSGERKGTTDRTGGLAASSSAHLSEPIESGAPGRRSGQPEQWQGGSGGDDPPRSGPAPAQLRGTARGGERVVDAEHGGATGADGRPRTSAPADSLTEARRLVYEQWLRRIPDDPGDLLRRKFALEYEARGAHPPVRSDAW